MRPEKGQGRFCSLLLWTLSPEVEIPEFQLLKDVGSAQPNQQDCSVYTAAELQDPKSFFGSNFGTW